MPINLAPWDRPSLIDHASDRREDHLIQQWWSSPEARVITVDRSGRFVPLPGDPAAGDRDAEAFIGFVDGTPYFARRGEVDQGTTIRQPDLDELSHQLAAGAIAILNWHDAVHHCPQCAGVMHLVKGGYAALCEACNREIFPRTDPAVIVAVLDADDRLFLAHHAGWAPGRASILAGFVEAGESAEHAVYREVAEESQLNLTAAAYVGSQPWPFPRSLMLGYVARATNEGEVDHEELEWGGWYSRDDVTRATAVGELILPGYGSIARRIVDAWMAGTLPAPEQGLG